MSAVVLMSCVQHSDAARRVLAISVSAFIVGELWQVWRVRPGATRADLGAEALFRAMFFGAILLIPIGPAVAPAAAIRGGGGEYFTVVLTTSEDQPVVDRGPYRLLRHPSYTGLLLAFVGCNLMMGNRLSTAASVTLLLTALVLRIRKEERALKAALGDRYRDFATGRARLVPFLW